MKFDYIENKNNIDKTKFWENIPDIFRIVFLIFILAVMIYLPVLSIRKHHIEPIYEPYIVEYKIIYPNNEVIKTVTTKDGDANVSLYVSGFLSNGPVIYQLKNKYSVLVEDKYPIVIINQYKL